MDPTAIAIIGWFVQVLFDQGITFVTGHWRPNSAADDPDLSGALDSLRDAMNNVDAFLPLTQSIRSENKGLLKWMKELKDAAYEADDIFSELDYYRLQQQVEGDDGSKKSSRGNFKRRVRNLCSCLNATNDNNQASTSSSASSSKDDNRASLVPRIKSAAGRLEKITTAIREILLLLKLEESRQNPPVADHRISTSFVPSMDNLIGRVTERDEIIKSLLLPAESVSMLPIVGIGGVGKTTLAKMVYNDEQIKKHFDSRIWVCVSDDFDVVRLTREILQCLEVKGWDHLTNLNMLQELLVEKLQSVRYLLVLDDVWNESEREKWGSLCAPLRCKKGGSRIVMTTRLNTVVSIAAKNMDMLGPCQLEGLPKDQYLSLFNTYAFGDRKPTHHPSLVELGKQIAGKLTGSPLAAKTVGGLLRDNLYEDHWKSVLYSDIWQLSQSNDDIMPALQLSHQHLPPHLQQCFIHCSVFPKDRQFKKSEMVGMWISQGYVHAKSIGNKSVEEIGSEYFDNLMSKSFIQANYFGKYVLHDLLHDLAESVSENEYLKINSKQRKEITSSVRHLHVHSNDLSLLKSPDLKNLRTLIVDGNESDDYSVLKEVLNGLKSIRVLILNHVPGQLLYGSIGHLTHMRYLAVNSEPQKMTPDSQWRPYHLQWLISGRGGFGLPAATKYLVSLRHLVCLNYYEGVFEIATMSGIGKLTCLQELKYFRVGKDEGQKLAELKRLNELKGTLRLECLDNASTKEAALEANLNKKEGLRKLVLDWGDGHATPHMAEEVLEGLCPPPYIKKLTLLSYPGVEFPTWMMTVNCCLSVLQSLRLDNCSNWKVLPPLGRLPLLRSLKIYYCEEMQSPALLSASLVSLEIHDCDELSSLFTTETETKLPSLREINIKGCTQLVSVELKSLPSLQKLSIYGCEGIESMPLLPATLAELVIYNLPMLTGFSGEQEENLSDLTSLHEIVICGCDHLHTLPLMPASLQLLRISGCPELPRERYQEGGDDWHKISHVPHIKW